MERRLVDRYGVRLRIDSEHEIVWFADGDSITAFPGNYTASVRRDIEDALPRSVVRMTNVAVSGQSEEAMLADVDTQVIANDPDIVSLCTSLNDEGTFAKDPTALTQNIVRYVERVLAHVNPDGLPPQMILMTDNLAGQNLDTAWSRPIDLQEATEARVLAAYRRFERNPNVQIVDNFPSFFALGVDSAALYGVLLPDRVHPNSAGYDLIHANMKAAVVTASSRVAAAKAKR